MGIVEQGLAWITAAVCIALLLRLALGARRRQRLDDRVVRGWHALARWRHRRAKGRAQKRQADHAAQAARAADEAIRRARQGVTRSGNVYTPKAFDKSRKPDQE